MSCERCHGNFPLEALENEEHCEKDKSKTAEIVEQVAHLIDEQNAGESIDWTNSDVELYPLLEFWRKTEKEFERARTTKLIALFEHQNEILKAGLKVTVK